MDAIVSLLTVSDTRTVSTDLSGPAAQKALAKLGFHSFVTRIVRDEQDEIQEAIIDLCRQSQILFTLGGTGFSPRDVTPEATVAVVDRRADNLSELIRLKGLEHTRFSYLSRGVCGIRGETLIVNLPGSPKAVSQGIEAIAHLLPPILEGIAGKVCPITEEKL